MQLFPILKQITLYPPVKELIRTTAAQTIRILKIRALRPHNNFDDPFTTQTLYPWYWIDRID